MIATMGPAANRRRSNSRAVFAALVRVSWVRDLCTRLVCCCANSQLNAFRLCSSAHWPSPLAARAARAADVRRSPGLSTKRHLRL